MTPSELQEILRNNPELTVQEYAWQKAQETGAMPATVTNVTHGTEHDAQVSVFKWIDANMERYPALRMAFAVPNGGKRDAATAGKMKAEGARAGVPDMFVMVPRMHDGVLYHALAVELKVGKNQTSMAQNTWIHYLRQYGYMAVVCRGADDAINTIKHYLGIEHDAT